FDTGMRGYIGGDHTHRLPPREECSLAEFDAALQTLNQSVPAIKRRIVVACAACILANQQVTVREAELLRAICDTLDCPLPPLAARRGGSGRTMNDMFASCARSEPLFVTSCAMMRCARFPPRLEHCS